MEANEGTQDGNRDGRRNGAVPGTGAGVETEDERRIGTGTGAGTEMRAIAKMGTGTRMGTGTGTRTDREGRRRGEEAQETHMCCRSDVGNGKDLGRKKKT